MDRRTFIKSIPLLTVTALATRAIIPIEEEDKEYFIADANKGSNDLRVYVDGTDVSNKCVRAKLHKKQVQKISGWVDLISDPFIRDEYNEVVTIRYYGITQWSKK